MIAGVSEIGVADERLGCGLSTQLAHLLLPIIALGALIAGPPAWASSDHGSVIAAGAHHTCALSRAGAVQCWGENAHGELGNGTSINSRTPVAVPGLSSGFVAIAAGNGYACALSGAGTVQCWGDNQFGQLGNGTSHMIERAPVAVSRLSGKVAAIAAGAFHTCALSRAGAVQCWGENSHGQLGNGMHNNSSKPVAVSGPSGGFLAIAAGTGHACALGSTGAMQCWGDNEFGQLGNGTNNSSRTPVGVSQLSGAVVAIAAGAFHTCALSGAGAAQCWGENTYGELGNGTSLNSSTPVAVSGLTAYTGRGVAGPTESRLSLWAFGESL